MLALSGYRSPQMDNLEMQPYPNRSECSGMDSLNCAWLRMIVLAIQVRPCCNCYRFSLVLLVISVFHIHSFCGNSAVVAQTNPARHNDVVSLVEAGWDVTIRDGQLVGARILQGGDNALVHAPEGLDELETIHTDADKLLALGAQRFVDRFPGVRHLTVEWVIPNGRAVTVSDYETLLSLPHLRHISIDHVVGPSNEQGRSAVPTEIETLSIGLGEGVTAAELIQTLPLKELHVTISHESQMSGMMSAIAENRRLECLEIAIAHHIPMQRLDLSPLFGLPRLLSLRIQNMVITPSQLYQLNHLKMLNICNCKFSSPGDGLFQRPTIERLVFELQSCENLELRQPITAVGETLKRIEVWLPIISDLALFADTDSELSVALGTQSPSIANCYESRRFREHHVLTSFGSSEFRTLAALKGLRELRFTGGFSTGYVSLSETAIKAIVDATSLVSLTGVAVRHDTATLVTQENTNSSLRELSLSVDPTFSLSCFSALAGSDLENLSTELPMLPKESDLEHWLPRCPKLRSLELKYLFDGDLSSKLAMSLYSPSLRRLRIEEGYIENGEIDKIVSRARNLEVLELINCDFEDVNEILKLIDLEHLSEVSVLGCNVAASVGLRLNASVLRIRNRDILELDE